ncbi:DoxX family protein [Nocardia sp. NPDC057227]|uniref:DoxX family protein n=1 Tax=Nocardia sp. NPDC057227 TaxID=3346056 RepID=UPI0036304640
MTAIDMGVLILRVCLGLTLAAHGYAKFFSGGRIPGTAAWFDGMGMRPGVLHARLAAGTEVGAGLALAAGFLTPLAAAAFVALMLVAAWTVHREHGFFIVRNGWEYNLVLAVAAVSVATIGAGRLSLDHLIFGADAPAGWLGLVLAAVLGVGAGVAQLALFYRPVAEQEQ